MNTKKLATLSTLAGGVLLILALFRGRFSQLLLIAYLCLWTIGWVIGWVRDADDIDRKQERKPSIFTQLLHNISDVADKIGHCRIRLPPTARYQPFRACEMQKRYNRLQPVFAATGDHLAIMLNFIRCKNSFLRFDSCPFD